MSKDINKKKALEALLDSRSLTEAADKAGITRRTLYGYIHHEPDFAKAYEELRSQQAILYMESMNGK